MNARKNFFRCFLARADTVGDADAVVRTAGQGESREFLQRHFDAAHPRVMADMILRH